MHQPSPQPLAIAAPAPLHRLGGSKRPRNGRPSVATLSCPADPDAELQRLGKVFDAAWAVERELSAHLDATPQPEWNRLDEMLDLAATNTKAIAEHILRLRASTLPGLLVKIRVASWCHSGEPIDREWLAGAGMREGSTATDGKSVLSIMQDLAAIAELPIQPSPPVAIARVA